jgi:branched-chain amino acid transport system permease protein
MALLDDRMGTEVGRSPVAGWPTIRLSDALSVGGIVGMAIVLPYLVGRFGIHIANIGTIMGIAAMALTVLVGQAGLLSLGHAAFMGVGAFTAGYLANKFTGDMATLALVAGVVGMVLGGLVALATVRAVGLYLAVGTLALQYVVELVLTDVEVKYTQATGFLMPDASAFGIAIRTEPQWLVFNAIVAVLVFLLLTWIVRSHVGRSWTVARENPTIAAALGISVPMARVSVFMLTSFIAAAAGALQGFYTGVVQVSSFPLHASVVYLTIVVLGRLGSLSGALIASYVIAVLPHALEKLMLAAGLAAGRGSSGIESLALGIILAAGLLRAPERFWALIGRGPRA